MKHGRAVVWRFNADVDKAARELLLPVEAQCPFDVREGECQAGSSGQEASNPGSSALAPQQKSSRKISEGGYSRNYQKTFNSYNIIVWTDSN